jgi:hypothetical protein
MKPGWPQKASPDDATDKPMFAIEVGQEGHLKESKIRFKVTSIDGDNVSIRYKGTRTDGLISKADLEQYSNMDEPEVTTAERLKAIGLHHASSLHPEPECDDWDVDMGIYLVLV